MPGGAEPREIRSRGLDAPVRVGLPVTKEGGASGRKKSSWATEHSSGSEMLRACDIHRSWGNRDLYYACFRVNRTIEVRCKKCPRCDGSEITRGGGSPHVKLAYDLKLSQSGINRQVIACTADLHRCRECGVTFLPPRYMRRDKHFHRTFRTSRTIFAP